jgi:hypothetical protein
MIIAIIIAVVLVILLIGLYKRETFLGAMTQMYARGPMDEYLMYGYPRYYYYDPLWLMDEPMRKSCDCY